MMNNPGFLKAISIVTGLLVAGEALALLIGMHLLSRSHNPWLSWKNDLLLVLDLLVGVGLIGVVVATRNPIGALPLYLMTGLGLFTHLYREWEYLSEVSNAFCVNPPLFVLNNVKIMGLLAVLVLAVAAGPWRVQSIRNIRNNS
jgi:hypothetical protein